MFLCEIETLQVRRVRQDSKKAIYVFPPTNKSRTLGLEENLEGSHITNFKKLYMCLCNLCVSMLQCIWKSENLWEWVLESTTWVPVIKLSASAFTCRVISAPHSLTSDIEECQKAPSSRPWLWTEHPGKMASCSLSSSDLPPATAEKEHALGYAFLLA